STSVWVERLRVVEESQFGAVMRSWSRGASGAKVHSVPTEQISLFGRRGGLGALMDGLSSCEHKLYSRFCDNNTADKDYISPVKLRAAGPAAEPMRLIAGTLSPVQPLMIWPPTGEAICTTRGGEHQWEEADVGTGQRGH
ncbi:hypothetical protein HOY82DRAFT_483519, partial [Tuber indicum]